MSRLTLTKAAILFSFLALNFAGAADGRAEDKVGRLPDGRAYRVDSEGNQLVDYIAELEMNAEASKRQLQALQEELSEKDQKLKLNSCPESKSAIQEHNLLNSAPKGARADSVEPVALQKKYDDTRAKLEDYETKLIKLQAREIGSAALEDDLRQTKKNLAARESELAALNEQVKTERSGAAVLRANLQTSQAEVEQLERDVSALRAGSSAQKELKAQLQEMEESSRKVREKLAKESQRADDLSRALQDERGKHRVDLVELANLRQSSSGNDRVLSELRLDLNSCRDNSKRLELEAARASARLAEIQNARVDESLPKRPQPVLVPPQKPTFLADAQSLAGTRRVAESSTRPQASPKQRALESARSQLQGELLKVKEQVAQRDQMYKSYRGSSAVSIKPSELVSRRKLNLRDVSEQLEKSSSFYEISLLGHDLREISTKVDDDIALLKRLQKSAH